MSQTSQENKTENKAIAVIIVFIVILALGFLGWYTFLFFRGEFKPMGATAEYAGTATSLKAKEYRNLEVSAGLEIKGQRSEYQLWDSPISFETEYHYEVLVSVPSSAEYFTISNLTVRLSYGDTRDYESGSSIPSRGTLINGGKSVFVERGHFDFTFDSGDTKYTSVYASYDQDSMGKPITEPFPGNSTNITIIGNCLVTVYSA